MHMNYNYNMRNFIFKFNLLLLTTTIFIFSACTKNIPAQTRIYMGTVCTINLFNDGTEKLYAEMFYKIQETEKLFSTTIQDSIINQVNENAGKKPVVVSSEFIDVLEKACYITNLTQGAFDPTIGPIVKLWNISNGGPVPSKENIEKLLPLVDYTAIKIDKSKNTVFLSRTDMALDLGGIAKGYIADQLALIAKSAGIKSALFDLGGNIYALGEKLDKSFWNIGIKDPLNPNSTPALSILVKNTSVVTSGAYERFFEENGKRYHHILDTKTGYPVENDTLSVTIICESSMLADALSTSIYVLGFETGAQILEKLNVEGILITKDKKIFSTPKIKQNLMIRNQDYVLHE